MPRGAEKGDTRPPAECWLCRAVWHQEGRWAGGQGRRGASSVQPGCWAGIPGRDQSGGPADSQTGGSLGREATHPKNSGFSYRTPGGSVEKHVFA